MPLGVSQKLLSAQSALNGAGTTGTAFKYAGVKRTTHYIKWSTSVSAGAVTIETADDETYTGTWAPIAVITYSSGSPKQEYAFVEGPYRVLRHRISTLVVGGTVSSFIEGDCD